jgi:hypothetical protein
MYNWNYLIFLLVYIYIYIYIYIYKVLTCCFVTTISLWQYWCYRQFTNSTVPVPAVCFLIPTKLWYFTLKTWVWGSPWDLKFKNLAFCSVRKTLGDESSGYVMRTAILLGFDLKQLKNGRNVSTSLLCGVPTTCRFRQISKQSITVQRTTL